ncbi:hypothetical protein, partial [Deinococcus arenae]|uniref:hypothetical protein n=1 Tax=Deinococcus arenae TaxID=1452751 RepID=UPI001E5336B5
GATPEACRHSAQLTSTAQQVLNRAARQTDTLPDLVVAQFEVQLQAQDFSDFSHRRSLSGHPSG